MRIFIQQRMNAWAARRVGWMSKAGGKLGDDLVCPVDGTRYQLVTEVTLEEITKI